MTTAIHEREFSRTAFLRGGGALVVGFSLAGQLLAVGKAQAAGEPFDSGGPYDPEQVDSWLVIHADNRASIKLGKVELGQGSTTGLLMIAGEELDLELGQLEMIPNDTNVTPDQGITAGSSAIQGGGKQTRAAAAAARQALLGLAATRLGASAATLQVKSGVVTAPNGQSVKYGELLGDKLFNASISPSYQMARTRGGVNGTSGTGLAPGAPGTKPVSQYTLVGTSPPRIDIPAKVTGAYTYVHNIRIPGMLHGRMVRPRGQGSYGEGTNSQLLSVDPTSISHIPGARVVRRNNFLGVVAPNEWAAVQAAAQLKVKWADPPELPGVGNIWGQMRALDAAGEVPAKHSVDRGNVDSAISGAAHVVSQNYAYHYQGHSPIGPSCALADVTAHGAIVMQSTQNAYAVRSLLQPLLGLPLNRIRVQYWEGSGTYGNSCSRYDSGLVAAVMSQLAGAPVRLQYMRWDDNGWDNFGQAQLMDIRGAVDAKGNLLATDYTAYSIPFYVTDPTTQQAGRFNAVAARGSALEVEVPPTNSNAVIPTDTDADTDDGTGTQYSLPHRRVTTKILPADRFFKCSFLRGPLGPQSVFGYEQMIDELAYAANMDPYQFRLQNIASNAFEAPRGLPFTWDRWKKVLIEAARLADWQPRVAASNLSNENIVTGRGLALGGYAETKAAIVADIELNKKTGKILVKHVYGAQDTGLTVYPGGVENQADGSIVQGASRALFEEVTFNKKRVTSYDFFFYPIMRIKDTPTITYSIIQRTDIPSIDSGTVAANGVLATGSGEAPTVPMAAAIGNAVFDATGVRIREAPMTAGRVRATLAAGGSGVFGAA
jgi:nicotinate dehydrogenase subunit B